MGRPTGLWAEYAVWRDGFARGTMEACASLSGPLQDEVDREAASFRRAHARLRTSQDDLAAFRLAVEGQLRLRSLLSRLLGRPLPDVGVPPSYSP